MNIASISSTPNTNVPAVVADSATVAVVPVKRKSPKATKTAKKPIKQPTKKKVAQKPQRMKYRFEMELPKIFTVRSLNKVRIGVKAITRYMRIQSALRKGEIVEVGLYRETNQRGRYQTVYALKNAKVTVLSVTKMLGTADVPGEFVLV